MYDVLSTALFVLALHYAAVLGVCAYGFARARRQGAAPEPEALPFVSVVVAARDEAGTIGACLDALMANDYPADRFEVVVVDDGSADGTPDVVRAAVRRHARAAVCAGGEADDGDERLRLIAIPAARVAGKWAALVEGVAVARGDLILTTDADAVAGPGWIRAMVSAFDDDTAFVAGPVAYRPGRTLFEDAQALEFMGLVAIGAGLMALGRPVICNSANAGYRRGVLQRVLGDAPASAGWSDGMLVQRIARETGGAVRFCARLDAVVETRAMPTVRAFVAQRSRWARSILYYPTPPVVAASALIYAFFVLLLAVPAAALAVPALWPAAGAAFALKLGAEAAVLVPACRHFGRLRLLRAFAPAEPFHVLYVVYAAAAGAFLQTRWKGRPLGRSPLRP